jgi:hypothetical protein
VPQLFPSVLRLTQALSQICEGLWSLTAQVPLVVPVSANAQLWHDSEQAPLQHTLSRQVPETHWLSALQLPPVLFLGRQDGVAQ